MLTSNNIYLRTLQASDLEWMLKWENNPANWDVSGTTKAFTQQQIHDFINMKHDLLTNKQLRYVICLNESKAPIGCIDLFEYNPKEHKAGVGILIGEEQCRRKGYATEALILLVQTAKKVHQIKQLFCNISPQNTKSIRLFENCGFKLAEERELFNQKVNYFELLIN